MNQSQFSDLTPLHKNALASSIVSANFLAKILSSILQSKEIPEYFGTPDADGIMRIAGLHFENELSVGLSVDELARNMDQQLSQVKPGKSGIIKASGQRKNSDNN